MNILVTGLCLQGNKGGMALAQALKAVLEREFCDPVFTFSVPSAEFENEERWALKLGLTVVKKISIKDYLPPWNLYRSSRNRRKCFTRALTEADLVVDLTALTYVGPPKGKTIGPIQTRFLYFVLSKIYGRPFLAWTQTYGPFSNLPMRFMAKLDLKRQPVIFCRGSECEREVKSILPRQPTQVFPDVACLLPYDKEAGASLAMTLPGVGQNRFVTLSPSSVLYQAGVRNGSINHHIKFCAELVREIHRHDIKVILVPHCYRPSKSVPERCDKAVCDLIAKQITEQEVPIASSDYSAIELKSIISNAIVHIGARYHSVIGALSSGVPCLSMSWHSKYQDAMDMYDMHDQVVEAAKDFGVSDFNDLFSQLLNDRDRFARLLEDRQHEISQLILNNAKQFAEIYQTLLLKSTNE
jgi:polysaccharide pyruvyl transferase WcaK-like protein